MPALFLATREIKVRTSFPAVLSAWHCKELREASPVDEPNSVRGRRRKTTKSVDYNRHLEDETDDLDWSPRAGGGRCRGLLPRAPRRARHRTQGPGAPASDSRHDADPRPAHPGRAGSRRRGDTAARLAVAGRNSD